MGKKKEPEAVTLFQETQREAEAKSVSRNFMGLIWFLNSKPVDPGQGKLREEVANDLTPIIKMAGHNEVLLSMAPLDELIEKINRLKLRFRWQHWLVPAEPGQQGKIKPGQTFLKFGDRLSYGGYKKCLVYKWIDYSDEQGARFIQLGGSPFISCLMQSDIKALRKASYGAIIESLEDGTFSKVKICKECQKFFIAKRLSDRFCNSKCSEPYFARDAKNRVKKSRERKRNPKEEHATGKHKVPERFREFVRLATKKALTSGEQSKLQPVLKRIGGWKNVKTWEKRLKKDASLEEIWEDLSRDVKRAFETA